MHHKPNFKCGYDQNANCTGIHLLPPPEALSCDLPNNFFLLPTKFQGVVQNVQFYDFGKNAFDVDFCITQYDPLGEGLFDAYGKLQGKGVPADRCYQEDPQYRPGILLPLPQLSAFSPAMLQAVPTVSVVGVLTNPEIIRTTLGVSLVSGCSGFKIAAKYKRGAVHITISTGSFFAYTNEEGTPVQVQVKNQGPWQVAKDSADQIQVWLIAQENIQTHKWTGTVAVTVDGGKSWTPQKTPTKHVKKKLIGTIAHTKGKTDIVQVSCSPIDLRDGTDTQVKGSDKKYVFIWDMQSGIKKWVVLNECG